MNILLSESSTMHESVELSQSGTDPGISSGGDDIDEEKIGRGLGAAVDPAGFMGRASGGG
jgi:hypothetical protein